MQIDKLATILTILILSGSYGCKKEPLQENYGQIGEAYLHWFETEKVAYLFFSVTEASERFVDPVWDMEMTAATANGGVISQPRAIIDFANGVHLHQFVNCGGSKICGSYSFHQETAPIEGQLFFRYDRQGALEISRPLDVLTHLADGTSSAYSALLFGVFDEKNQNMQIRVHDNFGMPNATDLRNYGMTRRFQVGEMRLVDPTLESIDSQASAAGSPLLFPATSLCPSAGQKLMESFEESQYWVVDPFNTDDSSKGVCFSVQYLDRAGGALLNAPVGALGRRNPVLINPTYSLSTPLKETIPIPILLQICTDEPFAGSMVDTPFLEYQKHVLAMEEQPVDLCFRTANTQAFKQELKTLLEDRLSTAKQSNQNGADFVFVVLFHHKFSQEFRDVHNALAGNLNAIAKSEADRVSPRLVGSFVYETSTAFKPTAEQQKNTIWCPQELADEIIDPTRPLANQNCTTTPSIKLDLKIINFVAPLGPLPSLAAYTDYVEKYGDLGLARRPSLHLYSVPAGPNTMVEKGATISFFDGERYTIGEGEAAKFCFGRDGRSLASFRFRSNAMADNVESYDPFSINNIWTSDEADESWRVGISWDFPFWGGIKYQGSVSGKVGNIVPFSRSSKQYAALGDSKWETSSWDLGHYIQHCRQFCDNPIFDEAGVYQPQISWRQEQNYSCPTPKPPIWEGVP